MSIKHVEEELSKTVCGLRKKFVARIVIDLVLMTCIGGLFPLLAFVIAINIFKDCYEIRLSLGRLQGLIDKSLLGDVNESTSTTRDRLIAIQKTLLNEFSSNAILPLLKEGLWLGSRITVMIWGYILFDILSPQVGVGSSL